MWSHDVEQLSRDPRPTGYRRRHDHGRAPPPRDDASRDAGVRASQHAQLSVLLSLIAPYLSPAATPRLLSTGARRRSSAHPC